MWDITIHPPWESDALVGTLAPHDRVALIPKTHSAVTQYCPLWARRPSRFCFWQLRSSFPVDHPSWDCSSINMLNLGVPIPSEAAEPPKGLVLDCRWRVRTKGEINCAKGMAGRYRASQFGLMAWRAATRRVIVRAMWRVSPRLVGDCRYVASQSALDWRLSLCGVGAAAWRSALGWGLWLCGKLVRAWLRTVARWPVSLRLVGDCGYVASQSALGWGLWLYGESVRAWLGTVARWPVSPRLVGDYGYVASQSALGWGLSRGGQSVRAWLGTVAMWRVSPRLVGDCREVVGQSALGWGLWLCGESVRAWLGTIARWPVSLRLVGDCGYVASQSTLSWGLSRGGQLVRAWLGTVAMWRVSPRLVGDCREVAGHFAFGWVLSRGGQSVCAWLGIVAMWRVNSRLVGDYREQSKDPFEAAFEEQDDSPPDSPAAVDAIRAALDEDYDEGLPPEELPPSTSAAAAAPTAATAVATVTPTTKTLTKKSSAKPPIARAAKQSQQNKEEDDDEDEDNVDVELGKYPATGDPVKMAKMQAILSRFSEEQMSRYESFRRAGFQKSNMKRLLASISGTPKISVPMTIVVSGIAKIFVGELVETGRSVFILLQPEWLCQRGENLGQFDHATSENHTED
ncbi:hypothetical protein ACLB2K_025472 [Fragaria x ananassa]